ncbi:MAG TPA: hypothetical protein VJV23_10445 [Candidatus Polarisedimenticolia bacterium]|nr:hypothetical protein [Candidatus Polarisedimenticolia bacterium]
MPECTKCGQDLSAERDAHELEMQTSRIGRELEQTRARLEELEEMLAEAGTLVGAREARAS